jgi:hypothetical protein
MATSQVRDMRSTDVRSISLERSLAKFTVAFVAIYGPLETWASWADGLTDPFYLVDFIGMVLLLWGGVVSLRASAGPGVMAAGWAWTGANFWRATFGRVNALRAGEQLDHGLIEMCVVACGTALALACLGLALFLTARALSASDQPGPLE